MVGRLLLVLLLGATASSAWLLHLQWQWPWADLFQHPDALPLEALLVQTTTLPRMLMALLAGGCLSLATMLLQQVMRNPLAADSTLAVSSGAQTALVLCTVFVPSWLLYGTGWVALLGAALALIGVLWLSARRAMQPLTVVLAGLVMGLYLSAISGMVTLFYSEETRGVMLWGAGSLLQDGWQDSLLLAQVALLSAVALAVLRKPLAILGLDDVQATALGISVRTIRFCALAVAAVLCASVVGMVGMLGFIGLAASSVVRQVGVRTVGARLTASFAVGALLLLLTDNILVLVEHYHGLSLPTGAVTALLGAPLLLWLMLRTPTAAPLSANTASGLATAVDTRWLRLLPLALGVVIVLALGLGQDLDGIVFSTDGEIWQLRWPRVLLAATCGVLLALCGVVLQRLTQNPMASPELLGISSGTAVGVMAAMVVFNLNAGSVGFWLAGIGCALLTLLAIVGLNRRNGMAPDKVLLTGMAVAALADAALRVWSASGDMRIQQLLVWLSGSTYTATPTSASAMALCAVLAVAICWPLARWLGLLSLGGIVAQANGVPVLWARRSLIVLCALLTASTTLLIGPLSFVGLLAPHMAQMLGARLPRNHIASAALLGALIMVLADALGRQLLFPYEIPAGLMATLLGGGYFLWMMRRV